MWFKKMYCFSLEQDDVQDVVNKIAEHAEEFAFKEDDVGNLTKNIGWSRFTEDTEEFGFFGNGHAYFKLTIATKKVPKDKLTRRLNQRINEETSGDPDKKLSKQEINDLKQAIEESLILEVEPKYKEILACVDILGKRIDVNSGCKEAEELVSFMRSTIGGSGLKAVPFFAQLSMRTFKEWLMEAPPENIAMGGEFDLSLDGTKVSYRKVYPRDKNLIEQIEEGYEIDKAALIVNNKVAFSVNAKGELLNCKMEGLAEEALDTELMDTLDYQDATFQFHADLRKEVIEEFGKRVIEG